MIMEELGYSKYQFKDVSIGRDELFDTPSDKANWYDLSFYKEAIQKIVKQEEDFLINLLTAYLNRVPAIEDFKKCEKVFTEGDPISYIFMYNGTQLGSLTKGMEGNTHVMKLNSLLFDKDNDYLKK